MTFTSHSGVVIIFGPAGGLPAYRIQGPVLHHRRPGEHGSLDIEPGELRPEWTARHLDEQAALEPAVRDAMIDAHRAACEAIIDAGLVAAL